MWPTINHCVASPPNCLPDMPSHRTKRAADRCYQLAQENETLRIERDKLCDKLRRLEEHRQRKKERKAAKQQGQQN